EVGCQRSVLMARGSLLAAIAWAASACTFVDPLGDLSGGGESAGASSGAACPEPGNAGAGSAYAWRQTKAYFSSDTRPEVEGTLDPQMAGGMNVIAIGWNSPLGSVTVKDSNGNCYNPAGEMVRGKALSQVIYYATNIKAGNNVVTVDFNP